MSDHGETSPAKAQLEAVLERCNSEDIRDKDRYDAHRRLLRKAIFSTNGAQNKIEAMAETQGELVAFIATQSIREPARLAEAFASVHMCPFRKDENGNIIDPPWVRYTDAAFEAFKKEAIDATPAAEESLSFSLPKHPEFVKWKGKESVKIGAAILQGLFKYTALVALIWFLMGRNNTALKKELKTERVKDLVSVLQTAGVLPAAAGQGESYEANE